MPFPGSKQPAGGDAPPPELEPSAADFAKRCGTAARVVRLYRSEETATVLVEGLPFGRFRCDAAADLVTKGDGPAARAFFEAAVTPLETRSLAAEADGDHEYAELVERLRRGATELLRGLRGRVGIFTHRAIAAVLESGTPPQIVDIFAGALDATLDERLAILKETDSKARVRLALTLVDRSLAALKVSANINRKVEDRVTRSQKEYVLRQQLKAIKDELGEGDDGDEEDELAPLEKRLRAAIMPREAKAAALKELRRLKKTPPQSPGYAAQRTYLEWMAELPWGLTSAERRRRELAARTPSDPPEPADAPALPAQAPGVPPVPPLAAAIGDASLVAARATLDAEHYGLAEVKRRVIEYLAVRKIRADAPGPILCLLGPPGVGKTSLARSVANALGRDFQRIALGGVHDEAEIRGHRRTYIGAMPGRVLQAVRRAGVADPVVLLDEVDKLGRDSRGDPAAALLEVLDPEQNGAFMDHYLNTPFDLSKAFFIATANRGDTIPPALMDRLEVVEIDGYTHHEKVHICERHLIPRQLTHHGLAESQLSVPRAGVNTLVTDYTREAGVRSLERQVAALCRAAAVEVAEAAEGKGMASEAARAAAVSLVADRAMIERVLGPPRFDDTDTRDRVANPGVVTGLVWTAVGGAIQYIEATSVAGKGSALRLTGQLGDVIKESAELALTWVKAHARALGLEREVAALVAGRDIHLHLPSGAVPKDGPSAGITMATCLTSLLSGRCVRADTAMTGEVTLQGVVLPVGGVRDKLLAAHRGGLKRVILPKRNMRDLRDVPDDVRQGLELIPVTRLEEVLAHAFAGGYHFQAATNEMATQRVSTDAAAARGLKRPVMHRSVL